jgi:hypothetical protein
MIVIPCFGGQASSARLYPPAPFYYGEGTSIYDSYPLFFTNTMPHQAKQVILSNAPVSTVTL